MPGPRLLRWLVAPSLLGGALGGWLLLETSPDAFVTLVPWLILLASVLVAVQRPINAALGTAPRDRPFSTRAIVMLMAAQAAVSIYGGYFGAGMGIIMLAALGFYGVTDILKRNALKNVLAAIINGVAGAYFIIEGAVAWGDVAVLAAGSIAGGLAGAAAGRRLGRRVVEIFVVVVGVAMAVALLIRQHA